jgi:GNAT superfamily N-acetyltransferase
VARTDGEDLRLGRADITAALLLSDEARWNQTACDWEVFADHGQCYGIRAADRLVASAAILPFGGRFGWISMVLVTSDWRRRGLASRLMTRCIEAMRQLGCASLLDATPEGALVYAQLGFRTQCGMTRWRGEGVGDDRAADLADVIPNHDDIFALDAHAFGGDRRFLLRNFLDRKGTSVLGGEHGFVMLRRGLRATQIGPLVARDDTEAGALLDRALRSVSGPVILDVLDAGASLHPALRAHGFEPFRVFERMVLDRQTLPGNPASMMIAAGPEFG